MWHASFRNYIDIHLAFLKLVYLEQVLFDPFFLYIHVTTTTGGLPNSSTRFNNYQAGDTRDENHCYFGRPESQLCKIGKRGSSAA